MADLSVGSQRLVFPTSGSQVLSPQPIIFSGNSRLGVVVDFICEPLALCQNLLVCPWRHMKVIEENGTWCEEEMQYWARMSLQHVQRDRILGVFCSTFNKGLMRNTSTMYLFTSSCLLWLLTGSLRLGTRVYCGRTWITVLDCATLLHNVPTYWCSSFQVSANKWHIT